MNIETFLVDRQHIGWWLEHDPTVRGWFSMGSTFLRCIICDRELTDHVDDVDGGAYAIARMQYALTVLPVCPQCAARLLPWDPRAIAEFDGVMNYLFGVRPQRMN